MKLILPLKREYFEAIKSGEKLEEYREKTDYWSRRLIGKTFDGIVLTWGYPRAEDENLRFERPWQGYVMRTIIHPHFGKDPVRVFAIKVN